jgi:hypothetical protein
VTNQSSVGSIFRPVLVLAVVAHAGLLLLPIPSKENSEPEPELKPLKVIKPFPRPVITPGQAQTTIRPKATPLVTPKPSPAALAPVVPTPSPTFPQGSRPSPTTPPTAPTSNPGETDGLVDLSKTLGATSSCQQPRDCWQVKDLSPRSMAERVEQSLIERSYQVNRLEDQEETGFIVFQVEKRPKLPYYVYLISNFQDSGTFLLKDTDLLSMEKALQKAEKPSSGS